MRSNRTGVLKRPTTAGATMQATGLIRSKEEEVLTLQVARRRPSAVEFRRSIYSASTTNGSRPVSRGGLGGFIRELDVKRNRYSSSRFDLKINVGMKLKRPSTAFS